MKKGIREDINDSTQKNIEESSCNTLKRVEPTDIHCFDCEDESEAGQSWARVPLNNVSGSNNSSGTVKTKKWGQKAQLDKEGHIILPAEAGEMLGISHDGPLRIVMHKDRIELYPNVHSLSKVYIEPTARCNLTCRTCIRETWTEPMGDMDIKVFDTLVEQLKEFRTLRTVMLGGFGEPTSNENIVYMVGRLKSLGVNVEMVSNGTLLDEVMLNGLIENGLDTLWVSFDGTSEECFEDVREGASFHLVVNNLKRLKELNRENERKVKVGIAFVVMKSNLNELKKLDKFAREIGAEMISVSNVLPYSKDMLDQMVCDLSVRFIELSEVPSSIPISLPLIDVREMTKQPLYELFESNNNISVMRNKIGTETRSCRFIKERCTFIRWDGQVAPCMGLLHSYKTYFSVDGTERDVSAYTLGDIKMNSLKEIWDSKEYHDFRDRVDLFDFSPCLQCGPCEFAEKNMEDCYGNTFPTCGGCLWAQGVIQCP